MTRQLHAPTKTTAELAHLHVPDFLTFDHVELHILTNILRDGNATQVYMALREYSDFVTGEFNGGYHNLMALCTPPRPERAAARPGPSYQAARRIIEDLINVGLVQRPDPTKNALQGQLRLQLTHVFRKRAPAESHNRSANRVEKGRKSRKSTTCNESVQECQQECQHGYQGVNTPLTPQTSAVIHSPATPHGQDSTSPPAGERKEGAHGQVAASRLMPGQDSAGSVELRRAELRRAELAKAHELVKGIKPKAKAKRAPVAATAPTSFKSVADLL